MVHNENTEWEQFEAQLDEVVHDTSESAQHSQSDASHDSQTYAQAQDELQSGYTYEDDSDLEEVDVDQFATESQAEMEAESGATAEQHYPTQETLATGPVVAEAPVELSGGSSSATTIQSAAPQSEAAANRARATGKGYLARRRAARKSASLQTAGKEAASQAGSMTPQAPSIVATSPATLPPPPPLPVGPAGRRQLWEEDLKLGLPHLKAGYRIALPPARPASAPVVGVPSAGPVPQVGARHQSAPVASTSRGKRSRDAEDRGDDVVLKRPRVNNAPSRKRAQAAAQSPSGGAHPPQWIPYAEQQTEPSRIHGSPPVAQQNAVRDQQPQARHQPAQQVRQLAQPRRAGPSAETSREMNGAPMYRVGREGSAAYTMRLPPPPTLQRPPQVTPGAGPSHRSDERTSAQTYAGPVLPSSRYDPSWVARTFSSAVLSASASEGSGNQTHPKVHGNATVPQQRQPVMPEAGPSRRAYEQQYEDADLQHTYEHPTSAQAYTMPVPSGWNDPAAIPRTFARAQSSTWQTDGQPTYRQIHAAPVAYAARPQQQMGRPVLSGHGGMGRGAEQLPSVDATGGQPVYNQPYPPLTPMATEWNSSAQLQAMSGGETVPAYLTMYAPPNHPPPGWNPQGQAPVYEQEPSARGQGSMSSAYGYGYDF